MSNAFYSLFTDLKVEVSRIPQATISALSHALSENRTIADAVAVVHASVVDLAEFRGKVAENLQKIGDLEQRVTSVNTRVEVLEPLPARISGLVAEQTRLSEGFTCLVGLVVLEDALEHWSEHCKEPVSYAWRAIAKPLLAFIANAHLPTNLQDECRKAWHELEQDLPNIWQQPEPAGHLRADIRKLRWALLPRS